MIRQWLIDRKLRKLADARFVALANDRRFREACETLLDKAKDEGWRVPASAYRRLPAIR